MATETQTYGIIKAKTALPVTDLLVVPHRGRNLTVRYPAFGRDSYDGNLETMRGTEFYHSDELPRLRFHPATTSESVSIADYNFAELAKLEIFDPSWLQLGRIVRTSEGVFANPPKDPEGNPITDEAKLKARLDRCREVNGIYLGDNDFGFAPYETFGSGIQDSGDFAEGGLAKVLEHTDERTAPNFRNISSSGNYPRGVNIWGLEPVKEPALRISALNSNWDLGHWLGVCGNDRG